jgi:Glycosyltransferase family 87
LYACSALFASVTGLAVSISLYRQWGQMAFGPYALAAGLMALVAWRARKDRRWSSATDRARSAVVARRVRVARITAFLIVLIGATLAPLSLEVVWRSEGNAAAHVQPEVVVVEQAGDRAAHGRDPYLTVDRDGHILIHQHQEPAYELYYPYLPGMVIFGVATGTRIEAGLTDARIQFLIFTLVITLIALSRIRPPTDARVRAFQVLTVLPTAALPLATGGDDMPVVALMLLGLAALQRRRPVLCGLALGAASSLKFTAWPLALLALWAVRDTQRHRAIGRYLLGAAAVVVPVVLPVAFDNPTAFIDNVVRFPLGLADVSSPAASALPGHILVSVLPWAHKPYVVLVGLVMGAVLIRHLVKNPPGDSARVAALTGWVMLIAIVLAPATRVGYLLYPINLFVWAWMLTRADDPADARGPGQGSGLGTAIDQLSSGSSYSSRKKGVTPVEVVGDTTAPTSQ